MSFIKFIFSKNYKNYVGLYLLILSLFSLFFLHFKHDVTNDSSVSEMLINYSGGFTRRGLPGHFFILVAEFFNVKLRVVIFFFQSFIQIVYFYLIYIFIKDLKIDRLLAIIIFLPIFLSYPIYEIESLGRKDVIIFIFYVLLLILSEKFTKSEVVNYYVFFILPVLCLIWEPVILFFPFIFFILILKNKPISFRQFSKIFLFFIPSFVVLTLIYLFPLTSNEHYYMCEILKINFAEKCYMSAALLLDQGIYFTTFDFVHKNANFYNYLRYFSIFLISFFPIYYYAYNIKVSKNFFFIPNFFRNLFIIFFFFNLPILFLFFFAYDWGRWIVFIYTFSALTLFFLIKNDELRVIDKDNVKSSYIFRIKKTYYLIIFIFCSFFWNIKTVITDHIGSFPIYRVVLKFIKFINLKYLY
jgi:hypothetical protein